MQTLRADGPAFSLCFAGAKGYRATNSISFRVVTEQAGKALDEIVARGVTRIDGVAFVASPKNIRAGRLVAIQRAVQDGINQAHVIIAHTICLVRTFTYHVVGGGVVSLTFLE